MTTETACAYLSLGESSLRYLAAKHGVGPIDCSGLALTRWRQSDLDRLLSALPFRNGENLDGGGEREIGDKALLRARERLKRSR